MILDVKNIQVLKKKLSLSIKAFQRKIKDVIEAEGVVLMEAKSNDVEKIVETYIPIEADQQSSNFQKILWEQKQYNTFAEKKQMKWHPLMIRFALSLHYASKSAYSFIANYGFLSLLSERTLRDYTHWCTIKNEIHLPSIQELKRETAAFTEQE